MLISKMIYLVNAKEATYRIAPVYQTMDVGSLLF